MQFAHLMVRSAIRSLSLLAVVAFSIQSQACASCNERKGVGVGDADLAFDVPVRDTPTSADTRVTPDIAAERCDPGAETCGGGIARVCNSDGRGYTEYDCSAELGLTCEAGGCRGPCSLTALGSSYIGCEYYATQTMNLVSRIQDFAIAVASASDTETRVIVTRGADVVADETVSARGVRVIKLPWVLELKGPDAKRMGEGVPGTEPEGYPPASSVVVHGAYRIRSSRPVVVYQFNAFTYKKPREADPLCNTGKTDGSLCPAYTNDASLLLPVHVLGRMYRPYSWPSIVDGSIIAGGQKGRPGIYAITATQDNTSITVRGNNLLPARPLVKVGGSVDAQGNGTFSLNRGDVVQVVADTTWQEGGFGADLSNSEITADKPIQVVGAHSCANIPTGTTTTCDHTEEVVLPTGALGSEYIVSNFGPAKAGRSMPKYTLRLFALTSGTVVRFEPPSVSPPITLTDAAPIVMVPNLTADARVYADRAFGLTQYMHRAPSPPDAEDLLPVTGNPLSDPSMVIGIPTRAGRADYTFIAPTEQTTGEGYPVNWMNVHVPNGATVMLDGVAVRASDFTPIAGTNFSVIRKALSIDSDVHQLLASEPVTLIVYGYGFQTSYAYPGGLNVVQ